jgi:hypothetical protein
VYGEDAMQKQGAGKAVSSFHTASLSATQSFIQANGIACENEYS